MAIRAEEMGRAVSPGSPRVEHARVLIADDQSDVREALRLLLKAEGYVTEAVSSPAAATGSRAEQRIRRDADGPELSA